MNDTGRRAIALILIVGLVGSVAIAGLASVFASPAPDGLERVGDDFGLEPQDSTTGVFDGYASDSTAGTALMIGVGLTVTGALAFGGFVLLNRRRADAKSAVPESG